MQSLFRKKRNRPSEEATLQITSMADIFTIILVFLLKSYATSAVDITPTKGMLLPEAHAADAPVEALKVEISADAVQVDGAPVNTLTEFQFNPKELLTNGSSRLVSAALSRKREIQTAIAQANPDVKVDSKILIIADQRTPYQTIKTVLASAALHGFTDFKLAVVQGK